MQSFTRFLAFAAAAAAAVPFLAQAAPVTDRATTSTAFPTIPGKYIITLKPGVDVATISNHRLKVREIHARNIARRGVSEAEIGGVEHEYGFGTFSGYSGSFDEATIAELSALDEVLAVEPDSIMTTFGLVTQNSSQWGLAAISSKTQGASGYVYDESAGEGQFNYVVDTGIRLTHVEFQGRAEWGFNAVNSLNTDNFGHGTHVSGIIGGATYGVAKKTTLVAVKVFEGSTGSTSTVISGFDWAVNDIVDKGRQSTAVINLSLGGVASTAWDTAITASWAEGVIAAVAAGNNEVLASTVSPARSPEVITVGNVQDDDARHVPSSYGPLVDIFAPGTRVVSSYYSSDNATASLTGTSMSSPHVAGLVSYLRALEGPYTAAEVKDRIYALGTPGRVTGARDAVNLIAYNGNGR
ncbi:subtilisin-like protein [Pleomassaria siparia CBS 279.74]|uniref:Subtilisin-like protein n=1 Tax=Pleomassaria siparia CBS 279.74 TaxID=1314801 RepID=A0A6G1KMD2_9PLEO|nr:subtilisin-like protein [Pleomassaria siparia CBS 279.74]